MVLINMYSDQIHVRLAKNLSIYIVQGYEQNCKDKNILWSLNFKIESIFSQLYRHCIVAISENNKIKAQFFLFKFLSYKDNNRWFSSICTVVKYMSKHSSFHEYRTFTTHAMILFKKKKIIFKLLGWYYF